MILIIELLNREFIINYFWFRMRALKLGSKFFTILKFLGVFFTDEYYKH